MLLALTVAFAASTATFNATYQAQAEVDAQLTNGADVTVTEAPGATVAPAAGNRWPRCAAYGRWSRSSTDSPTSEAIFRTSTE